MSSTLSYTPLETGNTHNEYFETPDSFFLGISDLIVRDKKFILDITENNLIENGVYMGKLMLNEKLILLIAQQCPTLNSWLLYVLTNNENVSGGFNGVFNKVGEIEDQLEEISFDTKDVPAISDLNIGKNDGNSFLTLGVN